MMNRDQADDGGQLPIVGTQASDELSDKWIQSRFNTTVRDVTRAMENFQVNEAVKLLYDFIWKDFCDWQVEFVKIRLQETSDTGMKRAILNRTLKMYEETLKLLHPFMPFVTEEIYQHLNERAPDDTIMKAAMPVSDAASIDPDIETEMDFLQAVISQVRTVRSEMNIPPSKEIDFVASCQDFDKQSILETNRNFLQKLCKLGNLTIGMGMQKPGFSASSVVKGQEIFIPLKGLIDVEKERERLQKEIERLHGQLKGVMAKLNNQNFVGKAPPEVIEKEKSKQQNFQDAINKLKVNLEQLIG